LQPPDDFGCRPVGPETVATAFGGSRRAETASDSSNRLASLSLGLSEPSAHRLATGDALHVLSAHRFYLERRDDLKTEAGRMKLLEELSGFRKNWMPRPA
jgi:hypothetical protein